MLKILLHYFCIIINIPTERIINEQMRLKNIKRGSVTLIFCRAFENFALHNIRWEEEYTI